MRKFLYGVLAVALTACAAQPQSNNPAQVKVSEQNGLRMTTTNFSPSIFNNDKIVQVVFQTTPSSCSVAHLSASWYEAEDITVCYDKTGYEEHYDVQVANAFSILTAMLAGSAGALAAIAANGGL